jgi:hypothetical protein
MPQRVIELTDDEAALLAKIDFSPSSQPQRTPGYWAAVSDAALELTKSLISRNAIPEVRTKYFTDPAFNIGGRGRSRAGIFEKNGTRGEAIFRHAHFLKYLHYFVYGPNLPNNVLTTFTNRLTEIGFVTSSDLVPLGRFARQLVRENHLDGSDAAEEFFKLALESGLELHEARLIRDSVKAAR